MEWLGCRIATSGKWLRLDKVEMVDAGDLASLPSAYCMKWTSAVAPRHAAKHPANAPTELSGCCIVALFSALCDELVTR